MKPRSENILNATIQEFIKIGEPVSSGWLYQNYDFGIKPAMIRLELDDLTAQGFLDQPYHSSGRIPSDQGYEFFTFRLLEKETPTTTTIRETEFDQLFKNSDWPTFLDVFSNRLGLLGALWSESENRVYKNGLDMLFDQMNESSVKEIKEMIRDFEDLDDRISELKNSKRQNEIRIFIGEKSPVTTCPELSVISETFDLNGDKFTLFAIGPKRMDYKKVVKTFQSLKK